MVIYYEQKDGGFILERKGIPASEDNEDYRKAIELIANNEADVELWSGSQRQIAHIRQESIASIKSEAIRRIGAKINTIPEINSTGPAIFAYQHTWPVANASAKLTEGKAIYDYAITRINQARNATKEQLEGYNPSTDNGWPA